MHDLHCKDAKDMHSEILSSRVYELKETEEGVREMCRDMEEIYSEGMEKGREYGFEEGAEKKAKEMVQSFAKTGLSVQQIAEAAKITIEVAQSWIAESIMPAK